MSAVSPEAQGGTAFMGVGLVLIIYLVVLGLALLVSLVLWVFNSLGMYQIAKRRHIPNAWLAWLPYGCNWILGAISDDYHLTARGEVRNRRSLLLWLSLATMVVSALTSCCSGFASTMATTESGAEIALIISLCSLLVSLLVSIIGLVYAVFSWICTYDLFKSCKPGSAVLFLVLSLLFGLTPIFVFLCRNSDEGMGSP